MFGLAYVIRFLTSFSSIDRHLLFARLLMLFYLTEVRFAQSSHLLMCMSLGTLTSTIRTFWPILVELIDLVNFAIIFVTLRWLTFLLGSLIATPLPYPFGFIFSRDPISSDHVSISIDFPSKPNKDAHFHRTAYDYSRANYDWWSSWSFERCSMGGYL